MKFLVLCMKSEIESMPDAFNISFLFFFCNQLFLHYILPLAIANPYNVYFRLLNLMPGYFFQDKRETFKAKFKEL